MLRFLTGYKVNTLPVFLLLLVASSCSQKRNWPQFRGSEGNTVSKGANLPEEWGDNKNVKWKYRLEGTGWSSPIVWEDKVFIVSAFPESVVSKASEQNGPQMPDMSEQDDDSTAQKRMPPPPGPGNFPAHGQNPMGPPHPPDNDTSFLKDVYRWEVTCINLNSGKELWKQVALKGSPRISKHSMNSYASETPVTDGERIYAYFGMTGLFCYDLDGKLLWKKDLGSYKTENGWGTGSSPIIWKDVIYIQDDNEENSFIIWIDAEQEMKSGEHLVPEKSSYSTPFIWKIK